MVNLNVNIVINDVMSETSAVTDVYFNKVYICTLSGENKTFMGNIPVNGDAVDILLKIRYDKEKQPVTTKNPFKKAIAYLVLFIVNIFSVSQTMECPYEGEEIIKLFVEGNQPKLSINFSKQSAEKQPQTIIQSEDVHVERSGKYFINQSVLNEIFSERNKAMNVFAMVPVFILLFLSLLSVFKAQYVTSVFLLLIIVLVLAAFIYSKNNLTKQYQKYLEKTHIQEKKQ